MSRLRTKQRRTRARRNAYYKAVELEQVLFVPDPNKTVAQNRRAFDKWIITHDNRSRYKTYDDYLKGISK